LHLTKYLPQYYGGIERVTRAMALAGRSIGQEVQVIGARARSGVQDSTHLPFEQTGLNTWFELGPIPIAPGFFYLNDQIQAADVIHIHVPNPMASLALLRILRKQKPKAKLITVIHAPILRGGFLGAYWQNSAYTGLLEQSDRFVITCDQMFETIPCIKPFRKKAALIPYPVEYNAKLEPSEEPHSSFRIISVGRMVPYKGFDVLVDAVSKLDGDWELTIIGDGPERPKLIKQVENRGLSHRVTLPGSISEEKKFELLSNSDLFVLPSKTIAEAYGMAVGEAFYCALPVVTTNLPSGLAFFARGGDCGAVVEPNSPESLTNAIQDMISDEERRKKAGQANLAFWKKELSMEVFNKRYEALIQSVLEITPVTTKISA